MDEAKILADLSSVLLKSSYDWVTAKRTQARNNKDVQEQTRMYEEIIDEILREQSDLRAAAMKYKDLYEQVSIKDEDIKYLRDTIRRVIHLFSEMDNSEEVELSPEKELKRRQDKQNIEALIQLIDKDTLKTMQLLGFNYKEGIGKPLTEMCAKYIYASLGHPTQNK